VSSAAAVPAEAPWSRISSAETVPFTTGGRHHAPHPTLLRTVGSLDDWRRQSRMTAPPSHTFRTVTVINAMQ
jgi:hypothetical protein